jgi:hypothetical protein
MSEFLFPATRIAIFILKYVFVYNPLSHGDRNLFNFSKCAEAIDI